MDAEEVLICLQALVSELSNEKKPYSAHCVREGMRIIKEQQQELWTLRGNTERRKQQRA